MPQKIDEPSNTDHPEFVFPTNKKQFSRSKTKSSLVLFNDCR